MSLGMGDRRAAGKADGGRAAKLQEDRPLAVEIDQVVRRQTTSPIGFQRKKRQRLGSGGIEGDI